MKENIFDKIFFGINMTWKKIILFAVIIGVYTGLIMMVPFLEDTSFKDIGISYEWWVVFAVIIVVNCKRNTEAMIKCFVFFLISQPLVYLVQVLCGSLSINLALNYYFNIWLPATFLTLPGGITAYYCKKQNLTGSIILGMGNTIQFVLGLYYFSVCIKNFPNHLLSTIVCFASSFIMNFFIQKENKYRIISIFIPIFLSLTVFIFARLTGRTFI